MLKTLLLNCIVLFPPKNAATVTEMKQYAGVYSDHYGINSHMVFHTFSFGVFIATNIDRVISWICIKFGINTVSI